MGVWWVGEVLVCVGEIELEEGGGVVWEWAGCEEGDVADDTDGVRRGRGGEFCQDGVRGGGWDWRYDQRNGSSGEGDMRTCEEGGEKGEEEEVVEWGERTGVVEHGKEDEMEIIWWLII